MKLKRKRVKKTMNSEIKAKALILNISKGTFTSDDGRLIGYANCYVAIPGKTTETRMGYEIQKIKATVEQYDLLKPHLGKVIDVELELKASGDNQFKLAFSKIADVEVSD